MNIPETLFYGGIAQVIIPAAGGAAGAVEVTGVKADDTLIAVHQVTYLTNGAIDAVADLTSEFSVLSNDFIDNTSGTSTSNDLLLVQVARSRAY
jgi:hypothetical protein